MGDPEFLRAMVADRRLAQLAIGVRPAWLWSTDGSRILWCNAAAAAALGIAEASALAKPRSPADPHRRQIAQLAGRLPLTGATRLDRLRGFGAWLGQLTTCACSRIAQATGEAAVLVIAMDRPARPLPRDARLRFITDAIEKPAFVVTPDGVLHSKNPAANAARGAARTVADLGLATSLLAETPAIAGGGWQIELHRLGVGQESATLAVVTAQPQAAEAPVPADMVAANDRILNEPVIDELVSDTAPVAACAEAGDAGLDPETLMTEAGPGGEGDGRRAEPDRTAPVGQDNARPNPSSQDIRSQGAPDEEALGQERQGASYQGASYQDDPHQDASRQDTSRQDMSRHTPPLSDTRRHDTPPQDTPYRDAEPATRTAPGPVSSVAPQPMSHAPLRFVWQTDPDGHFTLTSEPFLRAAGPRTAAVLGRAWSEIADALGLDPHNSVAQAMDRRETWNGLAVPWPLADGSVTTVELSGVPAYDTTRAFAGYRGFGLCRSPLPQQAAAAPAEHETPPQSPAASEQATPTSVAPPAPAEQTASPPPMPEPPPEAEPAPNVVQFRPATAEPRTPVLSAVENRAFDEIARRLTQSFDIKPRQAEPASPPDERHGDHERSDARDPSERQPLELPAVAHPQSPAWFADAAPAPHGDSGRDKPLLDLLPSGILIYRLDRLLYANQAFLDRTGFASLAALQDAGGLDALDAEPVSTDASSVAEAGLPLTITTGARATLQARLFTILWDNESAHALIVPETAPSAADPSHAASAGPAPEPPPSPRPASELDAVLDNATDGILLFDRSGAVTLANRAAQVLFNIPAADFLTQNVADLFAPESQRIVLDYFESIDQPAATAPPDHGREVVGRTRIGGLVPLSMTMGKIGDDGERFFAVFRDLSPARRTESELLSERRKAERAHEATGDALARISHEVRGPLNTIIGFANMMLEERFGALGNQRYADYLKDIRASGERAIAIVDDLVNITSIEAGNVELKLASQNLNALVEQCVGALQPQANRERVIIRTSLAHALPQVLADGQALRQITMNLITSSIRFSRAGGQVIVSTAAADNGGAILRVRDTGRGLSEAEVASAMDSQRIAPPTDHLAAERSSIDLSLARALAEANRARFQIRSTLQNGTLIEVLFPGARALAG
ncbi:histidine kinase [Afipia sp. P52-10]|uniref:sensor histidine kinase n=1 Tax=Afipia sp. P52-10 TaxID=1429916 RepID=UPI0003DF3CA7|nr:PAS domain-containing protein [Afipia sp. P52-10]ETR78634.1 histidine kinase [Afipia sp. P52-10]